MSFLFKSKPKSPFELVKQTLDLVTKAESGDGKKANEEITKNLAAIKLILYGDGTSDPVPEQVLLVAQEIQSTPLLLHLITGLDRFEFEAKKDVSQILNNLLRRQVDNRFPTAEFIAENPDIIKTLFLGYESQEIALNCGLIIRECVRHEPLTRILLDSQYFWRLFDYIELDTFDVASDAFATFKECLTKHKALIATFLVANNDTFFSKYTLLLNSSNYVTKRQSLKLLGELLLDRSNYAIMTKYISNTENLKLMMNLLRDKSRNIQFEAFHVFKVFIANPYKAKPVLDILSKNRDKLVSFLGNFHNDRLDDEQFNDEKAFLIKQILELPSPEDNVRGSFDDVQESS